VTGMVKVTGGNETSQSSQQIIGHIVKNDALQRLNH
jgi:hypothetical protein